MKIEEIYRYTQQEFNDLERLISQLSERLLLSKNDLERVIADNNAHLYVMRNTDNDIIACATLCIFNSPSSRKASIEDVVVHYDYRGQHLGHELMEYIISQASRFAPIEIQLTSKPKRVAANKLYQSLGFERKETNVYKIILP